MKSNFTSIYKIYVYIYNLTMLSETEKKLLLFLIYNSFLKLNKILRIIFFNF